MDQSAYATNPVVRTNIPARLDRLPWSRFHWLLVIALGASWAIDGLEVTLTGAVSGVLQEPGTLHLASVEIGAIASFYLLGAVCGSLICGWLTDRHGRAKLFFVTLGIYLVGTLLTAFSWNLASMAVCRWITGFGIGGEYAAINSAIDELIPARYRGRVDLMVNGTFWIGAAVGSGATLFFLNPAIFGIDFGWRLGFGIGAMLGLIVLTLRTYVPESPRWLGLHGHAKSAEAVMEQIEARVAESSGVRLSQPDEYITVRPRRSYGLGIIFDTMVHKYRSRSVLGLVLVASQAFLYNGIFFTYTLVLTRFYSVPAVETGIYLLPFALSNFLGPLLLGHFFDTLGRRMMISGTYALSAALLLMTASLFLGGMLTSRSQTALWSLIFFFASAAASSAYLTVSEIFPFELRALAIAVFYAIGTAVGGMLAPWFFGMLIGTGSRESIFFGYAVGAVIMLIAAAVEWRIGINAEQMSLERIASPLSAACSEV